MSNRYYVTTPIYYVNDRPHLGHVYATTIADIAARFHRQRGDDVFFLTGVDEHAAKVEEAAAARGFTPAVWAEQNAAIFRDVFRAFGITNDDFVRTSEARHVSRVTEYVTALMGSGDVYRGEYEGWYDTGQEEYVTDQKAIDLDHRSPFSGKPLVRRRETNYFFALSRYQDRLLDLITTGELRVQPDARRGEVLARLREGLNDVPISRSGGTWGIPVPGDSGQTIYVWIDALFNYLSYVDTDDRRHFWPADVHVVGKDILWFHAVLWPALLLALGRPLPRLVYAHSLWVRDGRKMSKSIGNVVDGETLRQCVDQVSLDGLRWFLATRGPFGAADSDFSETLLVDTYNTDLANAFGNCASRVTTMIAKYFGGKLPAANGGSALAEHTRQLATQAGDAFASLRIADGCRLGLEIVHAIDREIERRQPYVLARDASRRHELGAVLYDCAEALRVGALVLSPVIPAATGELARRLGGDGRRPLAPGSEIVEGPPLFPRVTTTVRIP